MNVYAVVEDNNELFIDDWRKNHCVEIHYPLNKEDQVTLELTDGAIFHISFIQSTNNSKYWYWHFETIVPPLCASQLNFAGKKHSEHLCSRAYVKHVWLNGKDLMEK